MAEQQQQGLTPVTGGALTDIQRGAAGGLREKVQKIDLPLSSIFSTQGNSVQKWQKIIGSRHVRRFHFQKCEGVMSAITSESRSSRSFCPNGVLVSMDKQGISKWRRFWFYFSSFLLCERFHRIESESKVNTCQSEMKGKVKAVSCCNRLVKSEKKRKKWRLIPLDQCSY